MWIDFMKRTEYDALEISIVILSELTSEKTHCFSCGMIASRK